MVWNYIEHTTEIEPGSFDEFTSSILAEHLEEAVNEAPAGSALERDLRARYDYVKGSESAIVNCGG